MPWIRDGDGLKLVGVCHYDTAQIRGLIKELSKSRNRPEKVCSLLEGLLATGRASKELVWRLSKWCDWNDSSERVARSIAQQLFHGNICRRLRDQDDMPIPDHVTAELDYQIWLDRVVQTSNGLQPNTAFPDEVDQTGTYLEGAVHRVSVNAYERNSAARRECLDHYGTACFVCGFDFGRAYDGIGRGYIHVHHLHELSKMRLEHEVDPIADLRPICPNCHVVIHLNRHSFTIDEAKAMVARARESKRTADSFKEGMDPTA